MTSPYETLGVPKDVTPEEIKKAFRRKAKAHHPDRAGGDAKQMTLVNKAYDTLGDTDKRKRFDETGQTEGPPTIEQEATERFGQLVTELLNVPDINIISTAKSKLSEYDREASKALNRLENNVLRLAKRRGNIRVKDGKHNIVHNIIDGQIADAKRSMVAIEHANIVMTRVREMLDDYESDEEPSRPVYQSQGQSLEQILNRGIYGKF